MTQRSRGAVYIGPWLGRPYDILRATGVPTNGRTCVACYGTGRIMLVQNPLNPTVPDFYMRATMVNGRPWPTPDHDERCRHCGGTGVMGPHGEPVATTGKGPSDAA